MLLLLAIIDAAADAIADGHAFRLILRRYFSLLAISLEVLLLSHFSAQRFRTPATLLPHLLLSCRHYFHTLFHWDNIRQPLLLLTFFI